MEKRTFNDLNEAVYTEKLKNGLTVKLIPKNDYIKTYAILYTDFGSIDRSFVPRGEKTFRTYPHGIAHFLEHKLFETAEGDISNTFSANGASVNAFTGNTKTAFQISFTGLIKENIDTLLNFVQDPCFTQQTVQDEKEIISQEIQMYKDDPDWNLTQGIVENLYPNHSLSVDVAGTLESVQSIKVDMLKQNYDTFYHPSNMQLIITGQLDPVETIEWIKTNQKDKSFSAFKKVKRLDSAAECSQVRKFREVFLPVSMPKVLVGIKGKDKHIDEKEAYRHLLCIEMTLALLFGETSSTYQSLYNDHLIDDSFGFDYVFERSFDYVSIGGDSRDPLKLSESIRHILSTVYSNPDMTFEHFTLVKKKFIGEYIQNLNSLEFIAHQFVDFPFEHHTVFDYLPELKKLSFEEVKLAAQTFVDKDNVSVFIIKTKEN